MHSRSRDSKKYTSTRQTHQKPIETCGAQGRPYVYQIRKLDFKQDEIRAGKGSVHSRNSSKRSKSSTPAGVSRVKEWMQELPDTPTLFVTEVVMPPEERASSRHRGIARTTHFVHEKSHAKSFTVPHEGSITRQVTTTTISANQQYSIQDALSTNHQSQAISNLEKPLPKSPSNPNSPTTDVEPAHLMIGEPGYNTRSRNTMEIVAVSSPPTFPTSAIPAADPTIRKKPSLNFVWLRPPNSAQNSEPINGDGTSPTKKWGRSFIKGLFDSSKPSNTVDASNVPRETRRGRSRSRGRNGAIIESANSEKSTAEAASYWSMIKDSVSTMSTSIKQGSASRGRSLAGTRQNVRLMKLVTGVFLLRSQ
ncbi:hypothetical protein BC829DRAFT_49182 [Chytridium lagenaria]|nr:hypothetical protein BC829DRAFT_49182 [Chytridium lagenaria]